MRFHLDHNPEKPDFEMSHADKVMLTGSCFSENIGNLLREHRFGAHEHPQGIVFNPLSVSKGLNMLVHEKQMDEKYILEREGVFFSFLHHSGIHDAQPHDLLRKINSENKKAAGFLKQTNVLIITLGTAWVYRHKALNEIVANCHKQAQQLFKKQLLAPAEITSEYSQLLKDLALFNPALKIIFTVSPVKYLKDGLAENNLGKATLLLAVHQLVAENPNCFYFPAYELVTDDLRDYRFYKEDLAHPNDQAIAYVWQKFSAWLFSHKTIAVNEQIRKLNLALGHRRLIANSREALKLNDFIIRQKELIIGMAPGLDL